MRDLLRGALAGLAGTAAMTAVGAVAKSAGLMAGEPPPRKVAREVEEAAGVRKVLSEPAFEASWIAQHFAYGAAAGAVYARLVRGNRRLGGPVLAGGAFGLGVWALSYAGWLPLAGIHPPPTREPRSRVGTEIASHLVYGIMTAIVYEAVQ